MNWKSIKDIYKWVLVYKNKIEYLGGNRYKLISFYLTGEKHWEEEYRNGKLHGIGICWYKNGQKHLETEYQNGQRHGKDICWFENGQKQWEREYQNKKRIK